MQNSCTLKSILALNSVLILGIMATACADQGTDLSNSTSLKSYENDEYASESYESDSENDSQSSDELWVQTESSTPWENSEADYAESSQSETAPVHHTNNTNNNSSNTLGGTCAPGCIWSSYAVQMGAQSAQASCGGVSCACVVDGDIWSSCSESDASSSSQDNNSTPQENQSEAPRNTDPNYNSVLGNQLADAAYRIAVSRNTVGYCYSAAADAIESVVGRFLWGASAYMAADQLAGHSRFFEVSVSDLRELPAGAVVVWARGTSAHGHISIALGNGREASDHVDYQMTYHYGGGRARVFYPR